MQSSLLEPADPEDRFRGPDETIPAWLGKQILADLLTLPADVAAQIFYYACRPIVGDPKRRRKLTPLALGRVSKSWREFAWSTSVLWTDVIVRVAIETRCDLLADLLNQWLARSKGRPLDIFFEIHHQYNRNPQFVFPLVDALLKTHTQWQHVTWIGVAATIHPIWAARLHRCISESAEISTTFPLLTSIAIDYIFCQAAVPPQLQFDFTSAPSLCRVLCLAAPSCSLSNIRCPSSQITELTISKVYDLDSYDLLRSYPNLRKLTLADFAIRDHAAPRAVENHNLRCLSIQSIIWFDVVQFLSHLCLPQLEALNIYINSGPWDFSLPAFIEYAQCTLTTLSLECVLPAEKNIIIMLSSLSLSSLTTLHIRDTTPTGFQDSSALEPGLSQAFFDALNPGLEDRMAYLPYLEILTYDGILGVRNISFLSAVLIRSRMQDTELLPEGPGSAIAVLHQVKIKADQPCSIGECLDAQLVWEVICAIETGVLTLITPEGKHWI